MQSWRHKPMREPRTCKWHNCEKGPGGSRARFTPSRSDQEFCSTDCRIARAAWRQNRGSTLVDLVIEGKWAELRRAREELQKEIK